MFWGLYLQFLRPVTLFSPTRRQIVRDERARMPTHLGLREELDRRRLGLPSAAGRVVARVTGHAWEPREVHVRMVPAIGCTVEIRGALHNPFVTEEDLDAHFERVVEDAVRLELFIPDDVPLVILVTEPGGTAHRIECPPMPM